jgi:hypothetical protein
MSELPCNSEMEKLEMLGIKVRKEGMGDYNADSTNVTNKQQSMIFERDSSQYNNVRVDRKIWCHCILTSSTDSASLDQKFYRLFPATQEVLIIRHPYSSPTTSETSFPKLSSCSSKELEDKSLMIFAVVDCHQNQIHPVLA